MESKMFMKTSLLAVQDQDKFSDVLGQGALPASSVDINILPHTGEFRSYEGKIASFPGPTQLSIACSTEKRERAWYLFSHEHDAIGKWQKQQAAIHVLFNRLHTQHLVYRYRSLAKKGPWAVHITLCSDKGVDGYL